MGDLFDETDVIQPYPIKKEKKDTTLEMVKESAEIAWLKTVGECDSFLLSSMFQHHVLLSQNRSMVLQSLIDAIVEGSDALQGIDGLKANYEFLNGLVIDHENRMNALKEECLERRENSKEQ